MKVNAEDLYNIRLTWFPVIFRHRCNVCGDYYIKERMWRWEDKYRIFTFIYYACQNCLKTKEDVVKWISRRPIKPPCGGTGESK